MDIDLQRGKLDRERVVLSIRKQKCTFWADAKYKSRGERFGQTQKYESRGARFGRTQSTPVAFFTIIILQNRSWYVWTTVTIWGTRTRLVFSYSVHYGWKEWKHRLLTLADIFVPIATPGVHSLTRSSSEVKQPFKLMYICSILLFKHSQNHYR